MTFGTRFRLQNAMPVATLSAGLLSGMAVDLLILVGDVPPPPVVTLSVVKLDASAPGRSGGANWEAKA